MPCNLLDSMEYTHPFEGVMAVATARPALQQFCVAECIVNMSSVHPSVPEILAAFRTCVAWPDAVVAVSGTWQSSSDFASLSRRGKASVAWYESQTDLPG